MQTDPNKLVLRLAESEQDRLGAARLRYNVFVRELGGDGELVDHGRELEMDRFDAFCHQLILVDTARDSTNLDHVVGVYRMLDDAAATAAGQFYSEDEYNLTKLRETGRTLLELGRSCVHPDYRGTAAMFLLWNGLADFVLDRSIEILFGVASFHGTDVDALTMPLSYLHHN
ncbi:MAG: GNAT family N-acetyltransferase, partial [Rhodobacteraceae bacterium]|nr:GNAT family N-acetyltransferase [Paracoccaceae bacterium]